MHLLGIYLPGMHLSTPDNKHRTFIEVFARSCHPLYGNFDCVYKYKKVLITCRVIEYWCQTL